MKHELVNSYALICDEYVFLPSFNV